MPLHLLEAAIPTALARRARPHSLETNDNSQDRISPCWNRILSRFLGMRKVLEKPNSRITAAYFPERGFASVVAHQANGKEVEVGLIGREA